MCLLDSVDPLVIVFRYLWANLSVNFIKTWFYANFANFCGHLFIEVKLNSREFIHNNRNQLLYDHDLS